MPARNNIHVPSESWPFFSWYVIEFAIVIALAIVVSWQINPFFEDYVVMNGWECEQESQETNCTIADEATVQQTSLNWIFWGIVGAIFAGWYLGARRFVLKRKIL
jgi:hypothetical protein